MSDTPCVDGYGQDAATIERLRELLAESEAYRDRVEALFAGGPDTPCRTLWRAVEGIAGEWHEVECVEVPMGELRAALAPQNDPRSAADAPGAPGQPGRDERGSGGRTGALAQVLLEYAISDDRTHAITHHEQAERVLADPGPLLEALAEAGILREEFGIPDGLAGLQRRTFSSRAMAEALADDRLTGRRRRVERRYVTEWSPDARP